MIDAKQEMSLDYVKRKIVQVLSLRKLWYSKFPKVVSVPESNFISVIFKNIFLPSNVVAPPPPLIN
jgi:hypothetical protein